MRKYVKPIAVVNSNLAEGVYAASGVVIVSSPQDLVQMVVGKAYIVFRLMENMMLIIQKRRRHLRLHLIRVLHMKAQMELWHQLQQVQH